MVEALKATEPFIFFVRLSLSELTGLRANNLTELLSLIRTVPDSSIYCHTHIFLQIQEVIFPKPSNDFVYWIMEVIGEDELAEELASLDTSEFVSIKDLREIISKTIENYLNKNPSAKLRFAPKNEDFHFLKSISFIFPTKYAANDLSEFIEILNKVSADSIYYHVFESRLRLEKGRNDFSSWIANCLGDNEIAEKISKIDPYSYSLEGLRKAIVRIIKSRLSNQ